MSPSPSLRRLASSTWPRARWMAPVVAVAVSTLALMQGSCKPIEKQPEEAEAKPSIEPWQRVDSLMLSGNDLRRLDVLDLEGTAELSSSARERMRTKILDLASGHARKYRDHLIQLAKLPKKRVTEEINARADANGKITNLPAILKVIDLHLRLTRADTPPSESRIIWDFGSLRYARY